MTAAVAEEELSPETETDEASEEEPRHVPGGEALASIGNVLMLVIAGLGGLLGGWIWAIVATVVAGIAALLISRRRRKKHSSSQSSTRTMRSSPGGNGSGGKNRSGGGPGGKDKRSRNPFKKKGSNKAGSGPGGSGSGKPKGSGKAGKPTRAEKKAAKAAKKADKARAKADKAAAAKAGKGSKPTRAEKRAAKKADKAAKAQAKVDKKADKAARKTEKTEKKAKKKADKAARKAEKAEKKAEKKAKKKADKAAKKAGKTNPGSGSNDEKPSSNAKDTKNAPVSERKAPEAQGVPIPHPSQKSRPGSYGLSPTGGKVIGRKFKEQADELLAAARTYDPEDMPQFARDIAAFPEAIRTYAEAMKVITMKAGSEWPVDRSVVEYIQTMYANQVKTAESGDEVLPAFRRRHDPDFQRHEAPRAGETKWNVK